MKRPIECPNCGKVCGRVIPATWTDDSYAEGPGENFVDDDGNWYCSEKCLVESSCGKPCAPDRACDNCADYWQRMRRELALRAGTVR